MSSSSSTSSSRSSSSESSREDSNSNEQGKVTPTTTLQDEQKRKESDEQNNIEVKQTKKSNKHDHTLSWENIVYKVKVPAKRNWKFQVLEEEHEKVILNGVSGFAKAGEVLAIMGPSGGGKTSLLDILAQRTELKDTDDQNTNIILVNGKPVEFYSCAYVKQEDLLMASATVRETLQYSAQLRLPSDIPYEHKMERVEKLLNTLELNQVADSRIGSELYRGVSGGEKKRVAIGVEMITNPKLLFLDEPTTGLDASMSLAVLKSLKRLAQENHCTVICTIHQPRYEIFEMFDKLMLLVGGRVAYFGDVSHSIEFFAKAGFVCQDSENPADFFLDVLQNKDPNNPDAESNRDNKFADTIVDAYNSSKLKEVNMKKLTKIRETAPQISKEERKEARKNRTRCVATPWTQLDVLLLRNFRNSIRDPIVFYGQMSQYILMGLLAAFLYYQIDHDQEGLFKIQMFLFWDTIYMSIITGFTYVLVFSAIRNLYNRERQSNSYQTGYFLIALSLYQIPMQFISIGAFSLITYFVAGLKAHVGNFFVYFCLNFLMVQASEALSITCSIVTPGFDEANALVTLFITFWFSFTSVFINNDSVKPGLYWISYTSYYKWCLEGLLINELKGVPYQCDSTPCPITNEYVIVNNETVAVSDIPYNCTIECVGYETGDDFLDSLHLTFDSSWAYIAVMGGIALSFRVISYLCLKYASAGKS